MNRARTPGICLFLAAACLPGLAQDDVIMQAMRDEMDRSLGELQLEDLEQPYFVAYTVREVSETRASAVLGAITSASESQSRTLNVEVRVGDRNLDNTNFLTRPDFSSFSALSVGVASLPLENDYREIRRAIWLATDGAYKQALDQISKKRAVLQNETVVEQTPDFSEQEPHQHYGDRSYPSPDSERVRALAAGISSAFGDAPATDESRVEVRATRLVTFYANSEGSSFVRADPSTAVAVRAGARSADGTEIGDSFTVYGHTLDDLPTMESLIERSRAMAGRLNDLRQAGDLDRYAGPVLFEGQAAAELVRQVLLPRLVAQKAPLSDDPRTRQSVDRLGNPFQDKLGSRVLPRFLAVEDQPGLLENEHGPLWGGYAVDDEGVPAQPTVLIQRGLLKTLLSTRNPVAGIPQSSGHNRGGGAAPSNLLVIPDRGLSADEMAEELAALVQERELEYGIVVRRLAGGGSNAFGGRQGGRSGGSRVIRVAVAAKVFPDGREEPIRNAVVTGVSDSSFRDIVAASEELSNHTFLFRSSASSNPFSMLNPARRFGALTTLVVPSLLFEDVAVRRPPGNIPRPPLVPRPTGGD